MLQGWNERMVSTTFEWAMAFAMMGYFMTFVPEFKQIRISEPSIVIITEQAVKPSTMTDGPQTMTVLDETS
jgi:hypothetical protein